MRALKTICSAPIPAETSAAPIIPPASHTSSVRSCCGKATSMIARNRNGPASPMAEARIISTPTAAIRARYGTKSRKMRRSDTCRAARSS